MKVLCYHIYMKNLKNIKNIVIISLDDRFSRNVASFLAEKLDMFVVDTKAMIAYELASPKEIIQKCGYEYLKEREKSVVKNVSRFENTIISISFDRFKEYEEYFDSSIIIYLKLPVEKTRTVPNKISYVSRDEFLHSKANIELYFERKSKINASKQIIEKLGEML